MNRTSAIAIFGITVMGRSGIGTTIAFGTNSTYQPKVRSINGMGVEREMFDVTHMGSAASATFPGLIMRQFITGDLGNPMQMNLGILFDPDEVSTIPIDKDPEQITITWRTVAAQVTGATWVFNGFVVSFTSDAPYDGLMEGQVILQPTGDIVMTVGADS